MKKATAENLSYMPDVPEWWVDEQKELAKQAFTEGFEKAKTKYTKDPLETIFGDRYSAESYRLFLRICIWAFSIAGALVLAIVIVMAGIYGIGKSYSYLFPPDPNAVQPIRAPESLAQAIYKVDRAKQNPDGVFSTNPWQNWEAIDEQTRNIYRKKAIARTEGKPEGEPGQEPPQQP